jgi:4'-phosphopantetheinyl transferase
MQILLDTNEVHLWHVLFDQVTDGNLLARCRAILSADETIRQQRFIFAEHRQQFLVSHALLRNILSCYADVSPAAWVFSTNAHGKPEIAGPAGAPPLAFNLSHTRGLGVVAVALNRAIGVDAENIERREVGMELAERYFAANEVAHLRQLEAIQRKNAFFDFWTLKEAYIKARGLGLALPLDAFSFHLEDGLPPRITFTERITDRADDWQFIQLQLDPCYKVAVAIHRPGVADLAVVVRQTLPEVGKGAI